MPIFQRLKKSRILLWSSLLSVVWLTLIPLAQAVPSGYSTNGMPQRLIICTSQGMVWVNTQNPGNPQDKGNKHDLGSCVVCFSHSVLAKILAADYVEFKQQSAVAKLVFGYPNALYIASSACHLPDARAPPVHIHA